MKLKKSRIHPSFVTAIVVALLLTNLQARTWTSSDGSKSFDGKLKSYDVETGTVIVIVRGVKNTFTQDKLSEDDIAWLKENGSKPAPVSRSFEEGKHLFILSGQSNMVGMKAELSFIPAVKKKFGKKNIIVVKNAHNGQSIRRWAKSNHEATPAGRPKERGDLYDPLITTVKDAIQEETLQTVTFVWMQGESDTNNTAYDDYLKELLKQLQKDLDFKEMNIVIGRISDYRIDAGHGHEGRNYIRKTQVKFAKSHPRGAWVDTDDLNDKKQKDGKVVNDLHYTPEGYKILGQRFAEKSIALILLRK